MPQRHRGPDGTIHVFPDDATDDQIVAVLGGSSAPNTPAKPERTWTDTAVDALPAAGGMVGSLIGGGKWNPLGATGAALGGGFGEASRQLINRVRGAEAPDTMGEAASDIAEQAAIQSGLQLGGRAVIKGVQRIAPALVDAGKALTGAAVSREMPITGQVLKGWDKARTARAVSEVDAPGNLVKARRAVASEAGRKNVAMNKVDIEDVLSELRKSDPVESVGLDAGTLRSKFPVVEPSPRGDMLATQPDKWGVTSIRPKADLDYLLRGVNERGPLRSSAPTPKTPSLRLTDAEERLLMQLGARVR